MPGPFQAGPRSESWKMVSKPILNRALWYVFLLHYTDPVLATAIFSLLGGSMRCLSGPSAAFVAMVALGSFAVSGCGKVGEIQGRKAFKEANAAYQAQDYKHAAEAYERAIQAAPDTPQAHQSYFFLGNSYDQLFKPSKRGEAANDAMLTKAVENYQTAAEKLSASPDPQDKKLGKLALEYLVSSYGADKLHDPAKAEPDVQKLIQLEPGEPRNYVALAKIYGVPRA